MPTTTSPSRPRSRTIDPGAVQRGVSIPDSWLRGVLAGAEAVFGTWLLVIVPVIAVYIATAASPELGSASWWEAARLGTGVWLAAHGAQLQVDDTTFTLIPLGLSLLAFFLASAAIRRAALKTWAGIAFATATYLAGTILLSALVDTPGARRAYVGAVLIAGGAALWAGRRRLPDLPPRLSAARANLTAGVTKRIDETDDPERIRTALTLTKEAWRAGRDTAVRLLGAVLGAATIVFVVGMVMGAPLALAVHRHLEMDLVSSVVFTGAQLLMVPTFIVWAASYLSGVGFTIGEGSLYSPAQVIEAPLPAIPALAALPGSQSTTLPVLGYTLLALGALAGWYLHRRITRTHRGEAHPVMVAGAGLIALALTLLVLALAGAAASGGFGPGRFAAGVGPDLGALLARSAWQLGVPMLVVLIALRPLTHRALAKGWTRTRGLVGRTAAE